MLLPPTNVSVDRNLLTWLIVSNHYFEVQECVIGERGTTVGRQNCHSMPNMSGKDLWKKNDLNRWRKTGREGNGWTSNGGEFQWTDAATDRNDDRRSTDGMVERAVSVLTTSEVGDGRVGQRHEAADLGTVEQDHAALDTPQQPLRSTRSGRRSQCRVARASYRDMVIATKSKHQTSCSVDKGLEVLLQIGWKLNCKIPTIESRMNKRYHQRTKAVVGDVSTQMTKLAERSKITCVTRFSERG